MYEVIKVDVRKFKTKSTTAFQDVVKKITRANFDLPQAQHVEGCPHKQDIGRDCNWPEAVCIPRDVLKGATRVQ